MDIPRPITPSSHAKSAKGSERVEVASEYAMDPETREYYIKELGFTHLRD